jgi:hypothetical protein
VTAEEHPRTDFRIDRVFSRFDDNESSMAEQRKVRNIPRRDTRGSSTVEVVQVRSGSTNCPADPSRQSSQVCATAFPGSAAGR